MPEHELASALAESERAGTLYRSGRLSEAIAAAEASGLSDPIVRLVHASAVYDTGNVVAALHLLSTLCDSLRDRPDSERFGAEFALFIRESTFQTPAEAVAGLGPLRQLATSIGDASSLAGLHLAVARIEALRGSSSDARVHLDIAKRLAANASSDLRCSIELVSASPLIDTGSIDKARTTAVWAFEAANLDHQLLPRSRALGNMGLFTLYLGNAKQARAYLDEARESAREMSFVQLGLADSLASVALFEGNLGECSKYLSEIDALSQAHRVPARSPYDLVHQITRCIYLSHVKDWQGILDVVEPAHPELERRQLRVWHASRLSAKAKALAHLGQHEEAENTLLEALRLCPRGAIDPLITVEAATGTCLTLRGEIGRAHV